MSRVYRLLLGVFLLTIFIAGVASLSVSQAESPVIRGVAAAKVLPQGGQPPQISSPDSAILDPIIQATQPPVKPAFYLVSVTMAKGVQGQDNSPVNPTSTFGSTDTFHAVAMIQDAPSNTNFTSIWYAVNVGSAAQPNTVIDTAQVLTDGTRNIDFSLTPQPNSSWPTGIYMVEIDVNGEKGAEVYFTVQ